MRRAALLLALAAICGPAAAQPLDCADATTTVEITQCADRAYRAADGELNEVYRAARERAEAIDASMARSGLEPPATAAVLLRDAQRHWIAYRDDACAAEAMAAEGGTIGSMLFLGCMEGLTIERTGRLRRFGEMN